MLKKFLIDSLFIYVNIIILIFNRIVLDKFKRKIFNFLSSEETVRNMSLIAKLNVCFSTSYNNI